MAYLLLAIFAAAGTTLALKIAMSRGMGVPMLNFFYRVGMGCSAVTGLFFSFSPQDMPALFVSTWYFMVPGIIFLYLAGITVMNAVQRGHIGISVVVIRSSLLLPVAYSLAILYRADRSAFFPILPWACLGCFSILLALGCFSIEQRGAKALPVMKTWPLWLAGAFFAQGGWDIVIITSSNLSPRETLFCYYLTSLGAAILSTVKAKIQIGRGNWPLIATALGAGTLALIVSLGRPLAVKELGGLIVFPTFAVGSMLLVQIFGSIFWKHRIGIVGWLGVLLSALGITILVLCRY